MPVRKIEKTPSADSYPLLIKHLLRPALRCSPTRAIVYKDIFRYDYQGLNQRIARLASALSKLGVEPGDTVGILDQDSHRYLESFFAVPMMGAVLHTVNVRLSNEQLLYTLNHARDKVLLVKSDFLPLLESFKEAFKQAPRIVVLTDGEALLPCSLDIAGEYETLLEAADSSHAFPDFDEDALATTFYTIGTTGQPKGVGFSHRQIVMHTYGVMNALCVHPHAFRLSSADVYMPLTPMYHVHAWGFPYLCTLLGTKQVYAGSYDPDRLLELARQENVSFSHCVPTVMHNVVNHPRVQDRVQDGGGGVTGGGVTGGDVTPPYRGWKVVVGGAKLSEELCRSALDLGINLISAYGMAETCPLLTLSDLKPHMADWPVEDQVRARCKAGLPLPLVELEIVDMEGQPVPHDGKSIGEVVVRAPWLTQAYVKDPQKSEALWANGWLHTGDLGAIDSEGYLEITDRLRDTIKSGGEWIATVEIENLVAEHEAVQEVAVTAAPDEKWGERPVALVVLKPGYQDQVTEADIKAFCREIAQKRGLPKYSVPDRIAVVEHITKTGVGKISKKLLREELPKHII